MNTLELLIAARKKIERPECWTKGEACRDNRGISTSWDDEEAVCWCGYGAIWSLDPDDQCADRALDRACGMHFPDWQDAPKRTHEEVLECFSRAIAAEAAKVSGNE